MTDSYVEKEVVRIRRKFFIPVAKSERYGFLFDLYCWLHMSEKENIALTDLGQWVAAHERKREYRPHGPGPVG